MNCCTFCKEDVTQLATHHLCSSCLDHLECSPNDQNVIASEVILKKEPINETECLSCLHRFPEDDLAQHRLLCTARPVFRCTLCGANYPSRETLWSHLDLHGLAGENKDSHYSEEMATYRPFVCALCEDQRDYPESGYWEHVHEEHDGFYLKCSDCGDCFRSKKLQADHTLNHCRARSKTSPLELLPVKQEPIEDDSMQVDDSNQMANNSGNTNATLATENREQPMVQIPITGQETFDHKCPHCDKEYHHQDSLALHISNSHKPTKCDKCDRVFEGRSRMSHHKAKVHRDPRFQCPYCPEKFTLKYTMEAHVNVHLKAESYSCHICERACRDLRYLAQHYRRYHYPNAHFQKLFAALKARDQGDSTAMDVFGVEMVTIKQEEFVTEETKLMEPPEVPAEDDSSQDKFTCPNTKQEPTDTTLSTTETSAQEGSITERSSRKISLETQSVTKFIALQPTGSKCPYCDKDFNTPPLLTRHIECFHEPIECDICGITSHGTTEARDHKSKIHNEKLFKCTHCPKKAQNKSFYVAHMTNHLINRKFTCEECGHKFNSLDILIDHFENIHGVENAWLKVHKPFISCYLQDSELAVSNGIRPEDLTLFQIKASDNIPVQVETNQQLETCASCDATFADKDQLAQHELACSQDQPDLLEPISSSSGGSKGTHKCPHCDKVYSNYTRLCCHIDEHHKLADSDVTKLELKCPDCPRVFFAIWRRNEHINAVHRVVVCDVCGESFIGAVKAQYHRLKSHTAPRFQCPHCPKQFHLKSHYDRHAAKHIQNASYDCEICGAKFKEQRYLKNHLKRIDHLKGYSKVDSAEAITVKEEVNRMDES